MKKIIEFIKKSYKLFICYGLITLGLLLFVAVLIIQPFKKVTTPLYELDKMEVQEVSFPIEQKIKIDVDDLSGLWLFYEDDSINDYVYEVTLTDNKGTLYFYNKFDGYIPNIAYMGIGRISDSKGLELNLLIECEECKNVKMSLDSTSKELKLATENYVNNNNIFYWHSILSIVLGLVLLPLANERGMADEKDN